MLLQRLFRTPHRPSHFLTHALATRTLRRTLSALPRLPIFEAIAAHDPKSTAVIHSLSGRKFSYGELLRDVAHTKDKLVEKAEAKNLEGQRIGFLVENGYDYIVSLLSILSTHSIALPLSPAFPAKELQYVINNSQACMVLSTPKFEGKAEEVLRLELESRPTHVKLAKHLGGGQISDEKVVLEDRAEGEGGMMLYTSGTTNRPKGVLLPTTALTAQSRSLIQAWNYDPSDHFLHVLPLHHIHGTVNALIAPLFSGSTIEFLFPFNALSVWTRFAAPFLPNASKKPITLFTAVPTVYSSLINSASILPNNIKTEALEGIRPENLRLSISGSAALPTPLKSSWTKLSDGNVLLERYGMTEIGMALSCGLDPATRIDGSVGFPLPGVEVRLLDTDTGRIIPDDQSFDLTGKQRDGEILVRGPTIFKEYWNNPTATASEFIPDENGGGKWFKTGDVAVRRATTLPCPPKQAWASGYTCHILGRMSSDIIKIGGEKVSALEIERELLSLPNIAEAAVVGLSSEKFGQKIAALVILKNADEEWTSLQMRKDLEPSLAKHKLPQVLKTVTKIERNAMGKINKKELIKKHFSTGCVEEDFSDIKADLEPEHVRSVAHDSTPVSHPPGGSPDRGAAINFARFGPQEAGPNADLPAPIIEFEIEDNPKKFLTLFFQNVKSSQHGIVVKAPPGRVRGVDGNNKGYDMSSEEYMALSKEEKEWFGASDRGPEGGTEGLFKEDCPVFDGKAVKEEEKPENHKVGFDHYESRVGKK